MANPITRSGYEKIRQEVERLKKIERPKVIKDIAEARSHGDLKENAEYSAAKERQSFIEGKIQELGGKLATLEIIDSNRLKGDKVVFGTTVSLLDQKTKEKKKYTLVGADESDLKDGKISVVSPVGRALIGHKKGDEVVINAPGKTVTYQILNISIE